MPTESSDQETIQVLLDDPFDEIEGVIQEWDRIKMGDEFTFKGKKVYENCNIKVIYQADGRKLVSFPFYKPFMHITKIISEKTTDLNFVKMGGQGTVTLDLKLAKDGTNSYDAGGIEPIYSMDILHDKENRMHATYEVPLKDLIQLRRNEVVTKENLVYIHAHR